MPTSFLFFEVCLVLQVMCCVNYSELIVSIKCESLRRDDKEIHMNWG